MLECVGVAAGDALSHVRSNDPANAQIVPASERNCRECGKRFILSARKIEGGQFKFVTCGRECAVNRRRRREKHLKRGCVACGKAFQTYNHQTKTCGADCGSALASRSRSALNQQRRAEQTLPTCVRCGKSFRPAHKSQRYRLSGHEQKYCSKPCFYLARSDAGKAKRDEQSLMQAESKAQRHADRRKIIGRSCVTCGVTFSVRVNSRRKYCTYKCIPSYPHPDQWW